MSFSDVLYYLVAGSIPGLANFFLRNDDSYCDIIHSSLTAVDVFDDHYIVKQPVAWKVCEVLLGGNESAGRRDTTEILLKH